MVIDLTTTLFRGNLFHWATISAMAAEPSSIKSVIAANTGVLRDIQVNGLTYISQIFVKTKSSIFANRVYWSLAADLYIYI